MKKHIPWLTSIYIIFDFKISRIWTSTVLLKFCVIALCYLLSKTCIKSSRHELVDLSVFLYVKRSPSTINLSKSLHMMNTFVCIWPLLILRSQGQMSMSRGDRSPMYHFPLIFFATIHHRAFIFHIMNYLVLKMTLWFWTYGVKGRSHSGQICTKIFPLIILTTIRHRALIVHL